MVKKILIVVLSIVVVVVLVVSGVVVFKLYSANTDSEVTKIEVGPIYETEEFTVNLSSSLTHFIRAKFAIEVSNEKTKTELEEKLPLLQDSVIMVLSCQTIEGLLSNDGKETLKKDLTDTINKFLNKGQVTNIYLKNFILS